MNSNDKLTIINQIKLLLKIFGGLSIVVTILVTVYSDSPLDKRDVIFPILFTISLTIIGLLILILIDYLKKYKEKRFFKKEPYVELDEKTVEIRKIKKSKYGFSQNQRIIELNGERFIIEYYDDFFKIPISDVLLVFRETEPDKEPKVINYKKNNYRLNQILEIIDG